MPEAHLNGALVLSRSQQYCTVPYCTALYCTVLVLSRSSQHYTVLLCTILVLSRSGDGANLSEETLARFKVAIKEHGYDPEELCTFDNSGCTN